MSDVERIFREAIARDAAERVRFLDQACQGQVELRAAVEARLAAASSLRAGNTVDPAHTSASENLPSTQLQSELLSEGALIADRYKLQRRLGEGGMGEVWVARQLDPVKRTVALKLIKAGMDSRVVLQRFEQERQALALMDHPHIARVLDGGMTAGGRPFFVMELVDGLPLTKYCDDARLTPRQRLDLFVPICHAVQHAHQKGIVHRDLKPANILVTSVDGRPLPKVIDFGVAKATAGKLTDATMSTDFGAVVGTLEYMAPEQAGYSHADIDTRADIYSLGVILYELLTGLRPFDSQRLKKAAITEMMRILQEEEPSKPSTRLSTDASLPSLAAVRQTEPRKLMALLRGELDWVVMKCLEKQRDRRYPTANALARDIQRYLDDAEVEARPPSAAYRLRKFVRRHYRGVLVGSLLLLALIVSIVSTTWGLVRSRQAEAAAIRERNKKEAARREALDSESRARQQAALARAGFQQARDAIDRAFNLVSENRLLRVPGMQPLRKQLLEEALQYYRAFADEWRDEPELRRDLARASFRVASITGVIDSKAQAVVAYREATRRYEEILQETPDDIDVARMLATCYNNTGKLLMEQQKSEEAIEAYEKALRLIQPRLDRDPASHALQGGLADVTGNLALVLSDVHRFKEANQYAETALAICQRRLDEAPEQPDRCHALAGILDTRGGLLTRSGRYAEAAAAFREAIALEQRAVQGDPQTVEYQVFLGNHYFNLALVYENYLQQDEQAYETRMEAIHAWEKLVAENPAVTEFRSNLAQGYLDLANTIQYRLPEKGESLPYYERARELLERLVQDLPEVARHHSALGSVCDGIGYFRSRAGQFDQARQSLQDAARHQKKAVELAPEIDQFWRFYASHLTNLSRMFLALEQPSDVIATLTEAVPALEQVILKQPRSTSAWRDLGSAHHTIGKLLAADGKLQEALAAHRRGLEVWQRQVNALPHDPAHIDTLSGTFQTLAQELINANRPSESARLREEEVQYWTNLRPAPQTAGRVAVACAIACLARGELAFEAQEWATALLWFDRTRSELQTVHGDNPDNLEILVLLGQSWKASGDTHYASGNSTEALPCWQESLEIYRRKLLPAEPDNLGRQAMVGGLLHNIGCIFNDSKDHLQALEYFKLAVHHQKIAYDKQPELRRTWLDNHYQMLASTLRSLARPGEAAAVIRERSKLWPDDPRQQLAAAGELGCCISQMSADKMPVDPWVDACLASLRRAIELGFKNAEQLEQDPNFDALRANAAFQELLSALSRPQRQTDNK
jgi:serine/threonine protein kinase/tetratricopeptide (TPR) repeat protein